MTESVASPPEPASLRIDQVVAATRTLFLRYGYRRTSVDDIAREAGVAKATLYAHFAGKEDMFRSMIHRFRQEMNARCDAAETMDAPVVTRMVELLCANYCTALEWFGDAAHLNELKLFARDNPVGPFDDDAPAFSQRVRRLLEAGRDSAQLAFPGDGPSIGQVAQTLIFAAHGAKLAQSGGAQGLRGDLDPAVRLILAGVRS